MCLGLQGAKCCKCMWRMESESKVEKNKRQRKLLLWFMVFVLFILLILAIISVGLAVAAVILLNSQQVSFGPPSSPSPSFPSSTSMSPSLPPLFSLANGTLIFDPYQKILSLHRPATGKLVLSGNLGFHVGTSPRLVLYDSLQSLHIKWPETETDLQITIGSVIEGLQTFEISWTTRQLWSLQDSYGLSGAHWYGGAQMYKQFWPIEAQQIPIMPYTTNDIYKGAWGGVQERYWLTSNHVALTVADEVPLWLGMNQSEDGLFTIRAQHKQSIYKNFLDVTVVRPHLNYTIYVAAEKNSTLKCMQLSMVKRYLGKPTGVPDAKMMSYPIWSTWAKFKQDINEEKLFDFASEITLNKFNASQIEIDDKWATYYGDMKMDPSKFPDPAAMVKKLNDLGFRVTLWVHPFANVDSVVARNVSNALYWIQRAREKEPALVLWWDGAGVMVDPTNPESVSWFVARLKSFRSQIGLTSYKFDAGETNWLPDCFTLHKASFPNQLTRSYVHLASQLGNDIEVRVGSRTQQYPHFVRIMDKDSRWGFDNGLRTVITCTLTFGILGYPFALPDMIGGNAYTSGANGINGHAYPDRQLYIRWLQANVFLPAVQFSISPWHYDSEVVEIAQSMMALRQAYLPKILALGQNAVDTGEPIIRPLWWLGDESEEALVCDSEFLLGNDLLVAPILEVNATARSVYLPAGSWKSSVSGGVTIGPTTIHEDVNIHQLAYYIKQ